MMNMLTNRNQAETSRETPAYVEWAWTLQGELTGEVLHGEDRSSSLELYRQGPDHRAVRGAQYILVLKWRALSVKNQLLWHFASEHVTGHGGGKRSAALRTPNKTDGRAYPRGCRIDIRGAVACSGTTAKSGDTDEVQNVIQFDAGPGMTEDGFKLTATDQPGFYGTIGRVGHETGCDKALTLGEPDQTPVHVYKPGDAGQTDTASYVFSLCRTGKPQDTGDYNMTLTATLVNV